MDLYDNRPVDRMWFGTEQKMGWIETPQTGANVSSLGQSANSTLLNGGGVARNSWDSHKVFQFSWGDGATPDMVSLLQAYRNGSYGRGLLYFHDPMFYGTNLLPKRWADPSMAVNDEAESIIPNVTPTAVPVVSTTNNYPVNAAQYRLAANYSSQTDNAELFFPIPPGMSMVLGAVYEGVGRVYVRTPAGSTDLTAMGSADTSVINAIVRDQPWARIGIRNPGATVASITITGMTARISASIPADQGTPFSWTNTAYNPAYEGFTSTPQTVRINGCINPKPITGSLVGWQTPGSATVTDYGYTLTIGTSPTTPYIFSAGYEGDIATGDIMAVRCKVRAAQNGSGSPVSLLTIRPHKRTGNAYYTPDGAGITVPVDGNVYDIAFYWTATVDIPNSENFDVTAVGNGSGQSGFTLSMDEVLLEKVPSKNGSFPTFFAGNRPSPDPDFTTAFSGAAQASPSVMQAPAVALYAQNALYCTPSYSWSTAGPTSMRLTPSSTNRSNYYVLKFISSVDAGQALRVSLDVKVVETVPGSLPAYALGFFSTGVDGNVTGPSVPNAPGVYTLEWTVNVPAGFTGTGTIRFYHAGVFGDPPVYVDNALVNGQGYTGPAFNPYNTPGANWVGATNLSNVIWNGITPIVGDVAEGPWRSGEGHSGCRFQGDVTVINYNGVSGGQIGLSAILQEVGAWE